ncbi:MAG TPA: carbohydrate-binding protein [Planctomycetota bacterium]|nr:carbohydrate-binding protein [Planctomycetota bacterium]
MFADGNRAPIAMASADKFVGKDPLTVKFNSEGTLDKDDGDTLTYAWDFGGKGAAGDASPSFTFKEPGVYNVVLTVTDKGGKKATAGLPIRVGNAEPVVKIVEPKAGAFFAWGQALPFKIEVSDDEDGSTADGKLPAAKIQVSGTYQDGTAPTAKGYEAAMLTGGSDKGRKLIGGTDCLACHQMNAISVGPAFVKIAAKYHKQDVIATLVQKVINGGSGVWGPMAMAPHPQHTPADVKEMVTWILSLADAPPPMNGATGSLMTPAKPDGNDRGVYIVTATYSDAGAKGQSSLTGSTSVLLRSRYIRAVTCTTNKGAQEEDCSDDGKGKDFGFIDHDDHISFAGIDLSATKAIEARVASAGAGGLIEVHAGSPTGKLVATIEVKPTGDWQKWSTTEAAAVTDPGGNNELFFVFKSRSGGGGGLFNLNWVHFVEK